MGKSTSASQACGSNAVHLGSDDQTVHVGGAPASAGVGCPAGPARERPGSFMEWPAPPSGVVGSPEEDLGMASPTISVLGVDLGKNACSVVGLDAFGKVVMRRRMRRETLIGLAEKLPPCVVGMEACCGAHHLGRIFAARGHDVRLMSPEMSDPTSRRRRTTIATRRGSQKRQRDRRCALST